MGRVLPQHFAELIGVGSGIVVVLRLLRELAPTRPGQSGQSRARRHQWTRVHASYIVPMLLSISSFTRVIAERLL